MAMNIFISHKQEDGVLATYICNELKKLEVNAYLDLLEGDILLEGEKLTKHIKERLNSCTDLLVVMSDKTQESWWVPFEIGMAAQLDFPIVSYLVNNVKLPDYLSYWPTLRKASDLPKYIKAKNNILLENQVFKKSYNMNKYATKRSKTDAFYKELKKML